MYGLQRFTLVVRPQGVVACLRCDCRWWLLVPVKHGFRFGAAGGFVVSYF
jgi:hypothetical protein